MTKNNTVFAVQFVQNKILFHSAVIHPLTFHTLPALDAFRAGTRSNAVSFRLFQSQKAGDPSSTGQRFSMALTSSAPSMINTFVIALVRIT